MLDFAQAAADATTAAKAAFDPASIGPGAVIAIVTAEAIQLAKQSGWRILSWVNVDSTNINRIVGGVAAFLVGLGISVHWDPILHQLIIGGLIPAALSRGLVQWASQQLYYRLAIDKTGSVPVPVPVVAVPPAPPVVGHTGPAPLAWV